MDLFYEHFDAFPNCRYLYKNSWKIKSIRSLNQFILLFKIKQKYI